MPVDTLKQWLPELRRAMIKVRPEFFSWPRQKDSRRLLDEALMKELFGARIRSWKRDVDGNKRIPLRKLNRWNEAILPLVGIGEDAEEETKLKTFIAQKLQELLRTFDPRIKRLHRPRKILIRKDALDDLE